MRGLILAVFFSSGFCGGCIPADPFPLPVGESSALAEPYEYQFRFADPTQYQLIPTPKLETIPTEIDALERLPAPERLCDGDGKKASLREV